MKILNSNMMVWPVKSQTKFFPGYCLMKLILDAGPNKDWAVLVHMISFPQFEEFQYSNLDWSCVVTYKMMDIKLHFWGIFLFQIIY